MPIWPLCVSTPSGGREPRPRGRLAAPYGSRGAPAHLASRLGKAARSRSHPRLVELATTTPAARQTITLDPQNQNSSTPAVVLGRVDGFDEDEAKSECDEGPEVLVRFLAAERNSLEALELADELLDAGAGAIERLREERWSVPGG